ncbi:hypothetical protein AB0K60_13240 [Thermopolyspora sp. NPDC052614]|uniref:hypothetical protein n=1 Tax=Thermopolyspora sp. NPDC052614 TaxID=3155682 RepID=UPI00343CA5FA
MVTTCVPFAGGVPAAPGPPRWWDLADPFGKRIDDPRWRGATAKSYPTGGGGAGEHAVFRALYHTEGRATSLYLSWHVKVDAGLSTGFDRLYVGFQRQGGTAVVVQINPISAVPPADTPVVAEPVAGIAVYERQGSGWAGLSDTPDWIPAYARAWIASAPAKWNINLRVPLISAGHMDDTGINLGDVFRMWYELRVEMPGGTGEVHRWPRTAPGFSGIAFPDPATWGDFRLGADPADCSSGVSLNMADVGTTNTPSSAILYSRTASVVNTIYARPLNATGAPIPANGISARFRLANWGSAPDWNDVADPSTLWVDIPGGDDVRTGAVIPAGAQGELSFTWDVNNDTPAGHPLHIDRFAPPGGGTPERRSHQCMLVELSGAGLDFLNNSVYRNMDVVPLGTQGTSPGSRGIRSADGGEDRSKRFERFTRDAEISIAGLPDIGRPTRDVYIYVETSNMPASERQEGAGQGSGSGPAVMGPQAGEGGDESSSSPLDRAAETVPAYRVHVFHDTGETIQEGSRTVRVLRPQGSFGYLFLRSTASHGWDHRLDAAGLEEVAPNFYRLAVTEGGKVTVSTTVSSWNQPRPWWWWLWELLVGLWERIKKFFSGLAGG